MPENKPPADDWFYREHGWLARHLKTFSRPDWPGDPFDPLFTSWLKAFLDMDATLDVALAVTDRMAADPPKYQDGHLPAILKLAGQIRAERGRAAAPAKPEPCPDCLGDGVAIRYLPDPSAPGGVRRAVFLCSCPPGRIKGLAIEKADPALRRRVQDILEHPSLMLGPVPWSDRPDNRFRYDARSWDAEADRPREPWFPWRKAVEARQAEPPPRPELAPAEPLPPAPGMPAGLTPAQEQFLFLLGRTLRPRFDALPAKLRSKLLDSFAGRFDRARALRVARWIADRDGSTPDPEPPGGA